MDNGKNKRSDKIITKKITAVGIVQGIGFRPLVYSIANKYGIKGTVRNLGGQAEIIVQSEPENIDSFLAELNENNHQDYEIVNITIEDMWEQKEKDFQYYENFQIIKSGNNDETAIIAPDLPTCPKCETELFTESDRRFKNPFISCMACGPRYTIIETLPYDRDNTTMKDFHMCPACLHEYTTPESRRFHAQTISCNDCGPYLILNKMNQKTDLRVIKETTNEEAFLQAVNIIKNGGILAVKGIGGFHFVCSPFMEETVADLRKLKGREEKPFAVMFDSLLTLSNFCTYSTSEKALLESKARPIVLLPLTNRSDSLQGLPVNKKMAESTGKGSLYCGAFLPCTPIQIRLTRELGPLIMTSANISDKPIIRDDNKILALDSPYLGGVLYNTRRIVRSVDDSVAKVIDGDVTQIIRRSRGYVPYPIFLKNIKTNKQIFAAGGDLKAAFCIYNNGNAVVSQYFGDLEEKTVFEEYERAVQDMTDLLKVEPQLVVCDLHPNYFSTRFACSLQIPVQYVQHHHAHIASVMAEHALQGSVIGVAFDGTGYGTDGNIWGGEFLICQGSEFTRAGHLDYTLLLGGDQSMKDSKKTATCFLIKEELEEYCNDDRSPLIKAALNNRINSVFSSSMGRLFDAVSSLLEIGDENKYEGECAINLEKAAILAQRQNLLPVKLYFEIEDREDGIIIGAGSLLREICSLRAQGQGEDKKNAIALGFHQAISDMVLKICIMIQNKEKINKVALSGGVFQNTLLIEMTIKQLQKKGFEVYYNQQVPPNDGSISLGQTYIALMQ